MFGRDHRPRERPTSRPALGPCSRARRGRWRGDRNGAARRPRPGARAGSKQGRRAGAAMGGVAVIRRGARSGSCVRWARVSPLTGKTNRHEMCCQVSHPGVAKRYGLGWLKVDFVVAAATRSHLHVQRGDRTVSRLAARCQHALPCAASEPRVAGACPDPAVQPSGPDPRRPCRSAGVGFRCGGSRLRRGTTWRCVPGGGKRRSAPRFRHAAGRPACRGLGRSSGLRRRRGAGRRGTGRARQRSGAGRGPAGR